MFDSSVVDVAIGLVFVFLLLSVITSSAKEGLEAIFKRRAKDLERGIKELVGSDGQAFVASLYNHGLINSLFVGKYGDPKAKLPTYIPSKNFALALMDVCKRSGDPNSQIKLPPNVKQAIDAFKMAVGDDVGKMQKEIEDWYDSSMDRVSGWYKRRSQWWIFGLGVVITIAVNADTINIARRLSNDKTLREAAVQAAQQELKSNPAPTAAKQLDGGASGAGSNNPDKNASVQASPSIETIRANLSTLGGIGLPLGWKEEWEATSNAGSTAQRVAMIIPKSLIHIPGWLLTALAISLGAPFWFDVLNKIMVVRSTVKPSEKSKEEGSKDPNATTTPAQRQLA
jgi:hypothetical protein